MTGMDVGRLCRSMSMGGCRFDTCGSKRAERYKESMVREVRTWVDPSVVRPKAKRRKNGSRTSSGC